MIHIHIGELHLDLLNELKPGEPVQAVERVERVRAGTFLAKHLGHCGFTLADIANDEFALTNQRSMSGGRWEAFCAADPRLQQLFGGEGATLVSSWPGTVALGAEHLQVVRDVMSDYCERNPRSMPGFTDGEWPAADGATDPFLARLVWLERWMDHALDECERPVFRYG